jgi:L-gulonolactone oxidase
MGAPPAWRNWAGNQEVQPTMVARPADVGEVVQVVQDAARVGRRVKAVGSGHSFAPIAATDGTVVDLRALTGLVSTDLVSGRVRVRAGTTFHELNRLLADRGLAMSNLADIDAQTLAGAISTGSHGTGARFTGLSAQVRGIELVLADGKVADCGPASEPELFAAARVGLGALGIITAVDLQCEPAFDLHAVEMAMRLGEVLGRLGELTDRNDHFEFFWFPHTEVALTKCNNRVPPGSARHPLHPARAWFDDEFVVNTVYGWTCRLCRRRPALTPRVNRLITRLVSTRDYTDASHRVFVSPRRVRFVETEFAVPREAVVAGLTGIRRVIERCGLQVSFPVEVRFAAADDIPLSTASGRQTAYLAAHMFTGQEHAKYFAEVEAVLTGLGGRPHWGKLHNRAAEELRGAYPLFDAFIQVRDRTDPEGRFANPYLDRVLGPAPAARG